MSDSLRPHGLWPSRFLCPWNVPGKNTGVGCHFLPQGIFSTQGSNLGLLHWQMVDSVPPLYAFLANSVCLRGQTCSNESLASRKAKLLMEILPTKGGRVKK